VNEAIDIAKLELDGRPDVVKSSYSTMFFNNLKSSVKPSLMIISHLEYEKVFEDVSVHFYLYSILYFLVLDGQMKT
jgi:hypothetical protein